MKVYFTSTIDIWEVNCFPTIFIWDGNSEPQEFKPTKDSLKDAEIIVFNSSMVIDYLRRNEILLPKKITDIFQIFKQLKGIPVKYHKYSEAKITWTVYNEIIDNKQELKETIQALNSTQNEIKKNNWENRVKRSVFYLKAAFDKFNLGLEKSNELERYDAIENPFNYLLCKRQYEGVNIDSNILHKKIDEIGTELNILNKKLRYEYNVFNPQNTNEVRSALINNNFKYLSRMTKSINKSSFWNFIKTGSEENEFLALVYNAYRISYDKNSLQKILLEDENKVYPNFDCCGTITGRSLVRSPHLQQLKRTSRDIVTAKPGFSLLYADYCQFEPGVLASISNDQALIECYNNQDLYSSLSNELFGNANSRSFCKIIFLSFMYGMSAIGLQNLIDDFFGNGEIGNKDRLERFFTKFTGLLPYKVELEKDALSNKRICSCLGNYRYIQSKSSKFLANKERRWILSQKIQGTASLILKTAILNCCKNVGIEFLIPMHDAALFQVQSELIESKREAILKEFENAMLKYCPNITPKIIFKQFTA